MKHALTLTLIMFALSLTAQRYTLRRPALWVGAGLGLVAGAAHGTHEKIVYHYDKFQARWPRANPQYWNPQVSWVNKYKDRNPELGRNGKPVVLTDAKHLLASSTQVAVFGAGICVTIGERRPLWHYAIDADIVALFRGIGNEAAFDWFYPKN